ncbi:MAG: TPM domain-containing protein [Caldimonas sp.]
MAHWLGRLVRHRLFDEGDLRRAFPPAALRRIAERVAASEARHTGQIRVCVEAGLPLSYLRRGADARERAIALFGKLRVWDTEQNNGVLIYLLLAEHAIEIVADRGLTRCVDAAEWQRIAEAMRVAFRSGPLEPGVDQAIDAVGALLTAHFTRLPGAANPNELPDSPVLR